MYLPSWTPPPPPPHLPRPPLQHFFSTVLTSGLHTITLMSTNTPCRFNANTRHRGAALHSPRWLSCRRTLREGNAKQLQVSWGCCRCSCGFLLGIILLSTCMSVEDDSPLCSLIFGECEGRHISGLKWCRVTDYSSHSGRVEHEIWAVAD